MPPGANLRTAIDNANATATVSVSVNLQRPYLYESYFVDELPVPVLLIFCHAFCQIGRENCSSDVSQFHSVSLLPVQTPKA